MRNNSMDEGQCVACIAVAVTSHSYACRCAIYPVDVIKSAQMTDSMVHSQKQYPNMVVAAQKLWAEGGVMRFYKGFAPCLIRAAPANAAMLYTVDTVNNLLGNH